MSGFYDDDEQDGGLYSFESDDSQPARQDVQTQQPSAADGLATTLDVVANPAKLLSDVIPPNPADSKFPLGWAVLGACAFAVLWAASIDSKGGKG